MLIIGSTQLTFTKGTGTFHCPHCDQASSYRHRHKREFLTVYFIPLIPLQSVGQFVECSTCRQTFEPQVAEMTADEVRGSQRRAITELIRRALVVIVAADDHVTADELAAVRDFARQSDLPDVTSEQILREAGAIRQSDMDLLQYIRHVAEELSDEDKDLLVRHAFLAATAGGQLSAERQTLLTSLPDAIGVPEWRFREVISSAADRG